MLCVECRELVTFDDEWAAHGREDGTTAFYHRRCFDRRGHRHSRHLFLFFLAKEKVTMKLILGDTVGLVLVLAETKAGAPFPLGAGPFLVKVDDPGGTIAVTDGTPDQTTPTAFKLNGTGNVGTVTVTVTDEQFNLVGTGSFDVGAAPPPPPPPPPAPDALSMSFAVPGSAPVVAAATAAPAASAAPAPASAAPSASTAVPAPASGRSDQP